MADQTEILTWGCSVGRNPPTSGILEQLSLGLAAQSARDESARAFERSVISTDLVSGNPKADTY